METDPLYRDSLGKLPVAAFWVPKHICISAWLEHAPFAFSIVQMLQPRTLVELGTHHGFSYLAFCQAVQNCGLSTRCYAVDTWEGDDQAGFYSNDVYESLRITNEENYRGFSTLIRSRFDQALPFFEDGEVDLLHIDGHHTYEDVLADYTQWLPKLSGRGVVLFHDTNVRRDDFGVWKLWKELSPQYPSIEFPHGNGLGVLCVGPNAPEPVIRFLSGEVESVQSLQLAYAALGGAITVRFLKEAMQTEAATKAAEVGHLHGKLAELQLSKDANDQVKAVLQNNFEKLQGEFAAQGEALEKLNGEYSRICSAYRVQQGEISRIEAERASEQASRIEASNKQAAEIERLTSALRHSNVRADSAVALLEDARSETEELRAQLALRAELPNQKIPPANTQADLLSEEKLASLHANIAALQSALSNTEARLRSEMTAHYNLGLLYHHATSKIQALEGSTFWRVTAPLRGMVSKIPASSRRHFRRSAKAMWWLMTPHRIPQRIQFIRARRAAISESENLSPLPVVISPAAPTALPPSIPAPANIEKCSAPDAVFQGWFDPDYYSSQLPWLADSGIDPFEHYASQGWREGYDPHPLFSTDWVVQNNPWLVESGASPLEVFASGDVGSPIIDSNVPRNWYRSSVTFGDVPTMMPTLYTPPGRAHFPSTSEHQFYALLEKSDVLSFDIFDTALLRRVTHPTSVFDILEDRARQLDIRLSHLADIRFWAERVARRKSDEAGTTTEISLSSIYDEIQADLQLEDELRLKLYEMELAIEREVLVANPHVLRWYRYARSIGKKVVFVSDMYLPSEFLASVLADSGFEDPEVYVSNEFKAGKWDCRLFGIVAQDLKTNPERILHVGDNAHSDKRNADQAGWRGLQFLEGANDQPYAVQLSASAGLDISNVAVSVGCGLAHAHRLKVEAKEISFNERFARHLGYEVIGPTMLAFAGWVASRAQADNLDRVLFLARDGFLVDEIYRKLRDTKSFLPESRYVAASRRMLYNRMFSDAESLIDVASRSIGFSKSTTITEYFDIFLLSADEIAEAASRAGITHLDRPLLWQFSPTGDFHEARRLLNDVIRELAPMILSKSQEAARLKSQYYEDAGALAYKRRVGVVDLGWSGTIVEPLHKIITEISPGAEVLSYFFGLTPKANEIIPANISHRAYSFEDKWPRCAAPNGIPSAKQPHVIYGASLSLMEILLSENCPSAIRLQRDSHDQTPQVVRGTDAYDADQRHFLNLAHSSALEFAQDAIPLLPDDLQSWNFAPLLAQVWNRILSSPSQEEARLLAGFPHRMDASGHGATELLVSQPDHGGESLIDQYWTSMWPAGWLALLDPLTRAKVLSETSDEEMV
ncbi:class I SAM-dependent methyltransferase [Asaia bogorensis]|uniref:class I SAM-dependent methyltransferase n=1 Tax=Asaia bogorensis TaxID=91915 RepID=UPI000EFB08A0|nr:class I SAM-dependent methyltransferase [Asaia bogorensis]